MDVLESGCLKMHEVVIFFDRLAQFFLGIATVEAAQGVSDRLEVHLAHAVALIARRCQKVHHRRRVYGLGEAVVEAAGVVRVLPCQDASPRRDANRRWSVGAAEPHPLTAQSIHGRSANVAIVGRMHGIGALLVRKNEEDVRLWHRPLITAQGNEASLARTRAAIMSLAGADVPTSRATTGTMPFMASISVRRPARTSSSIDGRVSGIFPPNDVR